jgi:hypothetical protein
MPLLFLVLTLFASAQGGWPYSITGEVHDSDGKPAARVAITAQQIDATSATQRPLSRSALSDANGRFAIKLDRPGKYRLIYQDDAHAYVAQYLPFFRDPNNPPPQVVITEAAPTAQVNISMSRNGMLIGEAIDAQTQFPIDNMTFTLCHAENRSVCWNSSRKSADGNFSIPTPFAPFTLRIGSAEYEDWFGLVGNDPKTQISVPAGTRTSLKLVMKRKPEAFNHVISEREKHAGIDLPAPQPMSPDDNQIFDIYPRVTRLEWGAVDGAVSYAVEVDYCQFRRNSHECFDPQTLISPAIRTASNILSTSYEFRFVGAQPGRWRVWAIDKDGRDGFKSAWRTFVYLR